MDCADPPDAETWNVRDFYGEPKNMRPTYGLTAEASDRLTAVAKEKGSNRSAVLEAALRGGGLEKGKEYYLSL